MNSKKLFNLIILIFLILTTSEITYSEKSEKEIKEEVLKPHILYTNTSIQDLDISHKFTNTYIKFAISTDEKYKSNLHVLNFDSIEKYQYNIGEKTLGGLDKLAKILGEKHVLKGTLNRETNKNEYEFKVYNGKLRDGTNYLSACVTIINIDQYRIECTKPVLVYTLLEENEKVVKISSKEEYDNYHKKLTDISYERLEKYRKRFNLFKIARSYNPDNLKIKNFNELEEYAMKQYLSFGNKGSIQVYKNIGEKLYNYDQNSTALNLDDYKDYMVVLLTKYEKSLSDKVQENIDNTASKKEEAIGNYQKLKDEILHNELSRKKALSFSKGLLNILKTYNSKESKLAKLDKINKYIVDELGPNKFEDQILIGYVLDYLEIVKYSLEIQ